MLPPVDPPYWAIPRGYGITHAAPRYSDGRRTGVVVGGVVPGSLADRMGLQRNDVLVVISGVPCDSLHRCRRGARRMEWALHMHQPFELVVEREEEVVVLRFTYQQLQPFRLRAP